jgi:hypothetical protein
VYFSVAADGTAIYEAALEGALTGYGTSSLRVHGCSITIDAQLIGPMSLYLDGIALVEADLFTAALLPGKHSIRINSTVIEFSVTVDGLIDYDPEFDGILSGRGTRSLLFLRLDE